MVIMVLQTLAQIKYTWFLHVLLLYHLSEAASQQITSPIKVLNYKLPSIYYPQIILLFPAYLFALIFEYAALYLLLLSLTGKLFLPELENHSLVAEMCAYAILMPNLIRLDQELKDPLTTLLVQLFVFASIDLKNMILSSFSTFPSILLRGKTIRFPPA